MQFKFVDFLAKFPQVAMPVTLGEETHHVFSLENEPIPEGMIEAFIWPTDPNHTQDDEFTEYVPCFAIAGTDDFAALVWWKAALLQYEYVLCTFSLKGDLIDRKVIAFTRIQEDKKIHRAVATIDEDWVIFIAEGVSQSADDAFDPTSSKTYDVEIMSNGEIV